MDDKNKRAFLLSLRRKAKSYGINTETHEIFGDDIGYTMEGGKIKSIYLNIDFFLQELGEEKNKLFVLGVFTHELSHQLFTNFIAYKTYCEKVDSSARKVFKSLANILEDGAIEFHAENRFGTLLLRSLRYTRSVMWESDLTNSSLDKSATPFLQYQAAVWQMIGYGLKGNFTFPEAQDHFEKTYPTVIDIITEPNGADRMEKIYQLFKGLEDLWKPELSSKNLQEQLYDDLQGNTTGENAFMPSEQQKEKIKQKMDRTLKKIGKTDASSSEDTTKGNASKDGSTSEGTHKENPSQGESYECNGRSSNSPASESSDKSIEQKLEQEFNFSDDEMSQMLEAIDKELEMAQRLLEKESKKEDNFDLEEVSRNILTNTGGKCSCYTIDNQAVPGKEYKERYLTLRNEVKPLINSFHRKLVEIFEADKDEKAWRENGSLKVERIAKGMTTANLFRKKIKGHDKKNFSCVLLVDNSGSMNLLDKIIAAKLLAIVFAETLGKLSIPYSCIGFSSDNYTVHHKVYVNWNDSETSRYGIASMNTGSCNADSVSIQYAAAQLEKTTQKNKVLFVLHDGSPTDYVGSVAEGIQETKKAIDIVRRKGIIIFGLGILLSDNEKKNMRYMYSGKDYAFVDSLVDIIPYITKKLKRTIDRFH